VFDEVFQRRKALTQVQVILIAVIVVAAAASGVYYYFNYIANSKTHSETPLPKLVQASNTVTQWLMWAGYNRTYAVHVSKIYDTKQPVPLVIALHTGSSSMYLAMGWGFKVKSDIDGGIIVAPQGVQGWFGWGICKNGLEEPGSNVGVDDVGFIRELIFRLEQQYKIDPNRIYAVGYSNGGCLAWSLGANLSDTFAAISPGGAPYGEWYPESNPVFWVPPDPKEPVSVVSLQNEEYLGASEVEKWVGSGVMIPGNQKSIDVWVKFNGCTDTPQVTSLEDNVIKSVYTSGRKGTDVVLYNYIGGRHEWVSNATNIIWDFFMSHPKQR
jgi:polyhydroxybutyrate depolymerase